MHTSAETLREAQTKRHCHPLCVVKMQAISDTLIEVDASKVVHTWTDTVPRMEIRTVDDTLCQLKVETLINKPSDALA